MSADGKVEGIRILEMSETPGVGTKVNRDSFLGQFAGITGKAEAGENVDIISGASFSSKAVIQAVNQALGLEVDPGN